MPKLRHLTNQELIQQIGMRDDLTELETELYDRFVRAVTALDEAENAHKLDSHVMGEQG